MAARPGQRLWAYHERASFSDGHAPEGPVPLDWARQPRPLRCYEGCPRLELPALDAATCVAGPSALDLRALAFLLGTSSGVSQRSGSEAAPLLRRCAPSAGNLHPVETYLVSFGVAGVPDGVHHYDVAGHTLEWRARALPGAAVGRVLVAFALVPARTAWKYGLRSLRSALLDLGHLSAALEEACALLGWRHEPAAVSGRRLARWLGTNRRQDRRRAPREWALVAAACGPAPAPERLEQELRASASRLCWQGRVSPSEPAFELSPPLATALRALRRPRAPRGGSDPQPEVALESPRVRRARMIHVLTRRSARAFGSHAWARDDLRALVQTLERGASRVATASVPLATLVFVNDVRGVPPGLLALEDDQRPRPPWGPHLTREPDPETGLLRLARGDPRAALRRLALGQPLAGDAAVVLAFLACFDGLATHAEHYTEAFLLAGRRAHAAYLWATACDQAACGLGGFDDALAHQLLGVSATRWRVLYLVALGSPLMA